MAIIINSQPQLGKTTEYRLSIQADLNGFSFSVIDEQQNKLLFLYSSDFVMEREDMDLFSKKCSELFKTLPLLRSSYNRVDLIYGTEKYAAIPKNLHQRGNELSILSKSHKIDDLDEIDICEVPHEDMVLIFAANSTFINVVKEYQPNLNLYPSVYPFISYLPLFEEYNKILLQYIKGVVSIVASEGERITYCNSFPAVHFNTALYFLMLTLKEVQFNPELTTVYISGNIKDLEIYDIAKYFAKIKYFRNPEIALPDQIMEMRYSSMLFEL